LRDYEDPERVFDLEDCLITDERVLGAWREIRTAAHLLPNEERLRGTVRWLGTGAAFALVGGSGWPARRSAELARACPSILVAHWTPDGASRRLLWDYRPQPAAPALSFRQVNPPVAEQLQADVIRHVLAHTPQTAIDAYSGVGDTAEPLSRAGVTVTAIELDREAAAEAARRLTPPSKSVAQRVERAIERALPADVVVLNPPRAGVDTSVTQALNASRPQPRAIVYVSCDPATLARDIARLERFAIASVQPYDMFPQTAHVETLCELIPRA
jgi:23S rRNA (uracil1939-C5)-methyltransferase